jgi:hypothetical protein
LARFSIDDLESAAATPLPQLPPLLSPFLALVLNYKGTQAHRRESVIVVLLQHKTKKGSKGHTRTIERLPVLSSLYLAGLKYKDTHAHTHTHTPLEGFS